MSAAILSGGTPASEIRAAVGADAGALVERGVQPRLAVMTGARVRPGGVVVDGGMQASSPARPRLPES
jgi:hypothetical protein